MEECDKRLMSERGAKGKGGLIQWDGGREWEPMMTAYQQGEDLAQQRLSSQMPLTVDRKKASCSFSYLLTDSGERLSGAKKEGQTCLWQVNREPHEARKSVTETWVEIHQTQPLLSLSLSFFFQKKI